MSEKESFALYQTLGIDTANEDVLQLTERDISRIYRRAALKWHPDKNPDDPEASDKFAKIFLAYETLTSPSERKVYDDRIRAARKRKDQFAKLDEGRKKLREQLESRERAAAEASLQEQSMNKAAVERMKREIERFRRELASDARSASKKKDTFSSTSLRRALDQGNWVNVPHFKEFRSSGKSSFEEFEKNILARQEPE